MQLVHRHSIGRRLNAANRCDPLTSTAPGHRLRHHPVFVRCHQRSLTIQHGLPPPAPRAVTGCLKGGLLAGQVLSVEAAQEVPSNLSLVPDLGLVKISSSHHRPHSHWTRPSSLLSRLGRQRLLARDFASTQG